MRGTESAAGAGGDRSRHPRLDESGGDLEANFGPPARDERRADRRASDARLDFGGRLCVEPRDEDRRQPGSTAVEREVIERSMQARTVDDRAAAAFVTDDLVVDVARGAEPVIVLLLRFEIGDVELVDRLGILLRIGPIART